MGIFGLKRNRRYLKKLKQHNTTLSLKKKKKTFSDAVLQFIKLSVKTPKRDVIFKHLLRILSHEFPNIWNVFIELLKYNSGKKPRN